MEKKDGGSGKSRKGSDLVTLFQPSGTYSGTTLDQSVAKFGLINYITHYNTKREYIYNFKKKKYLTSIILL